MRYRKIGGIHWLSAGNLRFAFCVARHYQPISHQWAVLAIGLAIFVSAIAEVFG